MTIHAGSTVPARGERGSVPTVTHKEPAMRSNASVQGQHIQTKSQQGVPKDPSAGGGQAANQIAVEQIVSGEAERSALISSQKGVQDPSAGGAEAANQMLIVEDIVNLVILNMWTMIEERIMLILNDPSAINVHPVLFMHIRRSQLLYLLDKKKVLEAVQYLASHIVGPFRKVIELGQKNLVFASVDYLKKEISWCETCVKAKTRLPHIHGDTKVLKHVVCDYFRMYIRDKISFEVPTTHKLWQFAFKTETPSGKGKPSFRCMVCSTREFTKDSIGKIEPHLNQCFLMETQYLKQLLDSCRAKPIDVASARIQARPKTQPKMLRPQAHSHSRVDTGTSAGLDPQTCTQALTQLPVLTRNTVLDRFKAEVSTARQIQAQLAEALQDSMLPTYLGNTISNIEMYAHLLFSSEQAVPATAQRDITSSGLPMLPGARLLVQDSSGQTGDRQEENLAPTPAAVSEQQPHHDLPSDNLPQTAGLHNHTKPVLPGGNDGTNTNG